ncbi:hypothetical protein Pelo_16108 [Pelomyxa schiedti]|nr:hypothetical protein Pelo_16108 [Pelomyxa schiedti]
MDLAISFQRLDVQSQFAAFLLASHSARCGCHSAARVMGGEVSRQLWDTWVIGTERRMAIATTVTTAPSKHYYVFRFGVSQLLMGITTTLSVFRVSQPSTWVSEQMFVNDRGKVAVLSTVSGEKIELEAETRGYSLCMNSKWWLQRRSRGDYLVVTNLKNLEEEQTVVPIPHGFRIVEPVSLNKLNSAQALILLTNRNDPWDKELLVVVDIETTYRTERLHVVSSTHCFFKKDYWKHHWLRCILQTRNQNGQKEFIVETSKPRSDSVLHVQANGTTTEIYEQGQIILYQLSGSLFALHTTTAITIWDCNSTPAPLRTIEVQNICSFLAGSGLIFQTPNSGRLQVHEATTDIAIASINFHEPCQVYLESFQSYHEANESLRPVAWYHTTHNVYPPPISAPIARHASPTTTAPVLVPTISFITHSATVVSQ